MKDFMWQIYGNNFKSANSLLLLYPYPFTNFAVLFPNKAALAEKYLHIALVIVLFDFLQWQNHPLPLLAQRQLARGPAQSPRECPPKSQGALWRCRSRAARRKEKLQGLSGRRVHRLRRAEVAASGIFSNIHFQHFYHGKDYL
jgi:hypothetical protein